MTTRESVELVAIVLGICVAFIIHFGFGESPSIESSTPRLKPALELDFNRPERTASTVRAPAGPSPARKRRPAAKAAPAAEAPSRAPAPNRSESPGYQSPSPQKTPTDPPAAQQPGSTPKSPPSKRSAPSGGGGARFDDSG